MANASVTQSARTRITIHSTREQYSQIGRCRLWRGPHYWRCCSRMKSDRSAINCYRRYFLLLKRTFLINKKCAKYLLSFSSLPRLQQDCACDQSSSKFSFYLDLSSLSPKNFANRRHLVINLKWIEIRCNSLRVDVGKSWRVWMAKASSASMYWSEGALSMKRAVQWVASWICGFACVLTRSMTPCFGKPRLYNEPYRCGVVIWSWSRWRFGDGERMSRWTRPFWCRQPNLLARVNSWSQIFWSESTHSILLIWQIFVQPVGLSWWLPIWPYRCFSKNVVYAVGV